MSGPAGLDIRIPIGGLFTLLGLVLGGYGLATAGDPQYARSGHVNVNLWWGLVMLLFGILLLGAAARARRRAAARPAEETPEGRKTEERERRLGLER